MTEKNKLDDHAHAMIAQKHQLDGSQAQLGILDKNIGHMLAEQAGNQEILDQLLSQAQSSITESNIILDMSDEESLLIESSLHVTSSEITVPYQEIQSLDYIKINDSMSWDQLLDQVEIYAARHSTSFEKDPFHNLMNTNQRIALEKKIKKDFSLKNSNCDKDDYMVAGTCGLIGGLIDVFFVGVPGKGPLTHFTDDLTDKTVQQFAKLNGWKGHGEGKDPTASAIAYLERNYKVNYDHRHGGDVDGLFNMSTKNHHIKSLAHSPDIVGLFFSILDQFTSTAHFFDDGKIVKIDTETFELKGSDFVSKIFSGFVNWLGHLFSDVAGSSGAKGRGSGIPIPFYSLLQLINVGEFGQHKQTFAQVATQVFEKGYDFRHGMAMAIPVLVTELLTRISWVVKQRFYHKKSWLECMPSANNPELRRMLLIAHGSLCLVDTTDATLRSGGCIIKFMLQANIISWVRFGTLAMKELGAWYRMGDLDINLIDAYLEDEYKKLLPS